ncbi:MAG: MerR family transcriptional regulator [Gammaproteobacteria bacterium]|nr:MerR family transcriptional regulator [Gammaproteobacteria bacterium]MYF37629.1 MerR family transcriptional regulator [Gammaproteobacteria bacterium]
MPDQESSKPTQDRYYTIGEVSTLCEVKQHVLRYWETQFEQLQKLTRLNGRRYYTKSDIDFIGELKDLLYTRGFTISGAQKFLATGRVEHESTELTPASQSNVKAAIADLQDAKQILKQITIE